MATVNYVQEASTMNHVACNIPRISTTLDGREANHQSTMVEIQGNFFDKEVFVLIDLGSTLSYVSPAIVGKYKLEKEKTYKH